MFNCISHTPVSRLAVIALAAMLAVSPAMIAPALAQQQVALAGNGSQRSLEVVINKSMLIDLPVGVAEVIVSQPSVAAAIMRTRQRAIIQGIGAGVTNIFFLDDRGQTISVLDISVVTESSPIGSALETALARIIPGSAIHVESITLGSGDERVVLSGTVPSSDDADRALLVATQFAGGPDNVANLIDVSGSQQVMLQVTVSEVKRDVAKQLGINLSGTLSVGTANFGFNNAVAGAGFTGNGVDGAFNFPNLQIDAAIKALEGRGALRVLAQPTLTAISGEDATFLAGGEIPYQTTDGDGNVSIEYKPYGVELAFSPTIKSNGVIGLKVDTRVSEPQADRSLTSREATTTVELQAGTTLAIGGLLEERVSQQLDQLPGLGNIPILGALFRSRDYQTSQTELVILVTPYLVNPTHSQPLLPTDRTAVASDAESIFLGTMETNYGVAGSGGMRGSFSGSVGFVLD